ncbi:hypothetical protein A3D07_04395 [Candidatus Curtissbacteria bacterium RIFCSPHIGHO2_02_FULL_42_15]|uniref:Glycosyl transferase family 1 domain-containing protein n=1 Tax=Candidatus Curtissbacteria bacterium RIFCSPHIGHO2_02_FULL_42_15 TaxID=1797716 RepID=A0A1F5GDN1_9BACT|nr:MAG: hypothetical protein A3D07_04395 [Candidatus Curtissbacteria bacterium RIFCSPHIGHO2_02_FULL_42_15]
MKIGLDGNEANIENRVGSGKYARELIKQFANLANYSSSERSESRSFAKKSSRPALPAGRRARTIANLVVYLKQKPLADLPKESKNFKYKVFGPGFLWTQFALPVHLTFGRRPDIFFSMSHYGPRFSPVPYVITIFDLSYLHYPGLFKKEDLHKLTNWTKYSIKGAKHILAISESTKDDIVKNYDVDPTKITVTYIGYDQKLFKPQSKERIERVKRTYKIKGDYVIFVGTLQPRKNIERLIEAFAQLVRQLQLVIVGKKGWMYDSFFIKVKDLDIKERVIFTDYVPDNDLPALISGAKTYVLPSLWEGFGIPIVEAQACGVPVVVSNVSSLPEIVAESGILVNPNDVNSIVHGIKKSRDEKTRTDLVEKGFENIKRFSWEKCAEETLEVLEKVATKA